MLHSSLLALTVDWRERATRETILRLAEGTSIYFLGTGTKLLPSSSFVRSPYTRIQIAPGTLKYLDRCVDFGIIRRAPGLSRTP